MFRVNTRLPADGDVRAPDAEINEHLPACARRGLESVELGEHVGGQFTQRRTELHDDVGFH